MLTPIQQGAEAVRDKVMDTAGAVASTATNAAMGLKTGVENVASRTKQTLLWPVTPRPVR
jgi:hypothetical protein